MHEETAVWENIHSLESVPEVVATDVDAASPS